uniref:hypothetical protein n=1 Tax=Sulfurimonas sp. TaxID=2022749 RepID=UPI003D150677
IRSEDKIIMLDNFTFKGKDIKNLLTFLREKDIGTVQKISKTEIIGSFFLLSILFAFYYLIYIFNT